ncbi:zinc finger protein 845-like [Aphidius gifuensis]|uniref:zinc finger protein 845-like n=1 Tax=Aphidius gifuensis TaxID=684658 RepID=UPI001CDB63E5|nr:zinc finger protein 845-like [Aphidius gifuensis]
MNTNFYGSTMEMNRVCRVCLAETDGTASIYTQPITDTNIQQGLTFAQKIKICGEVEVNNNDNFPSSICEICSYRTSVAYDFRIQCQNSDQRLRLYYEKPSRLNSIESATQTDPKIHIKFHKNNDDQSNYYVKQELQNINNPTMNTIVYQNDVEHQHHHHQQQQQHHHQQQQHHHQQQPEQQVLHHQHQQHHQQETIIDNNIIQTDDKLYLCQIGYENTTKDLNKNSVLIETQNIDDTTNCIQNNTQILIATDGSCEQRIHDVVDESLLETSNNKTTNSDEYFNGHILVTSDGVVVAKPSEQTNIQQNDNLNIVCSSDNNLNTIIDNNNDNINDENSIDTIDEKIISNHEEEDDNDGDVGNDVDDIRQPTMRAAKSSGKSYNDDNDDYQCLNEQEKQTYNCNICQKKYTSIKRLKNHSQTHEKKYKCKICARLFYKFDNYDKHIKIHETKPHACQQCHTSFTKPQSLERHLKSHKSSKFQPSIFKKINNNNNSNNINKNNDDDNNKNSDNDSGDGDDDDNDNLHMDIDDNFNKPPGCFKCTVCGQLCSTLKSLKRHSLLHGDKKYSCTVCEQWFYRPDTLKKHAEKHGHGLLDNLIDKNKLYDSSDDDYPSTTTTTTPTTATLKNDINTSGDDDDDEEDDDDGGGGGDNDDDNHHDDEDEDDNVNNVNGDCGGGGDDDDAADDDDNNKYKCQHCDKIMKSKKGLIRHVSMHKPKAEPVTCGICNKVCASQARLALHQKTHNKPKDKIPREYLCHVCSKVYPSNSSLTYHMRTHTGIKPHVCKICNSRFTTTTSLANHTRIHTGDKPFVCHVCSAAFAVSSAFRRHMTRHTGEANYLCKECGKRFKRLSTLKEHTYTHSGEKPYVCKNCGVAYSHSGSLFAHQKRCKIQYNDINNEQHNNHNIIINQNQIHVAHHIHVNNVPSAVRSLGVIGPMF